MATTKKTNTVSKRPRGRPRLSEEEKLKRKAEREKNKKYKAKRKKQAQVERRKSAKQLVEEEINNKTNSNIELVIQDQNIFEKEVLLLEPTRAMIDSKNEELTKKTLSEYWEKESKLLTRKIEDLEVEMVTLSSQLEKLKSKQKKLLVERTLTRELIRQEQDLVFNYEQKIATYKPRKTILNFFIEDEADLHKNIAKYRNLVQSKADNLTNVNIQLIELSIVVYKKELKLNSIEEVVDNLRSIRFDLGKNFMWILDRIRTNASNFNIEQFMVETRETVQRINLANEEFSEKLKTAQTTATKVFNKFEETQVQLAKTYSRGTIEFALRLDNLYKQIFEN